jgi:L-Ala-D/L-Glu epimerase
MVVDDIEVHYLRLPLTKPYKLAFGALTHYDTILVVVRDTEGAAGCGEACVLPGYTDETVEGSWALVRELAAAAPGRSFAAAKRAFLEHVDAAPFVVTALVSALEHAEGSALLRVERSEYVPILGIVSAEQPPALEPEIENLLRQGYRTLKVKVGFELEADLARLAAIQDIVGGRCLLRVDANQGYSREQALHFVARMRSDGIELLEQPCGADDWDAARAVAAVAPVPMMLDESIYDERSIERAAKLRAASYIKLKLMKAGGLERLDAMLRRIAELGMTPVLGNGVATDISCWMEACVLRRHGPSAGEMNGFLKPAMSLLEQPLQVRDGAIVLDPQFRPALSAEALRRYGVAREHYARPTD